MTARRLRVGLVGAGPWATLVHGPMLAASPHTQLVGVWARRPDAAVALAAHHGAQPYERFEDLCDACEAVAFAVPPDVQARMAVTAAAAGCHLLLEKPIAADLPTAEELVAAVADAGVGSLVMLSWRFAAPVRAFLDETAACNPIGGGAWFISSASLGGAFASPWRRARGPVLDVGPHVLDLLEAALGPVAAVRASGTRTGWVSALLEHEGGGTSTAALCSTVPLQGARAGIEVFGDGGARSVDCATAVDACTFATVTEELAAACRGMPHPLDVSHGLRLQRLLHQVETAVR